MRKFNSGVSLNERVSFSIKQRNESAITGKMKERHYMKGNAIFTFILVAQ